jgi:hypothetical protein
MTFSLFNENYTVGSESWTQKEVYKWIETDMAASKYFCGSHLEAKYDVQC